MLSACRCSSGWTGARCPRRSGSPTRRTPRAVAEEFVFGLVAAGTTTALVFGSHFASAVDALFAEAERVGLRVTCGPGRQRPGAPGALLTTPERAYAESRALAARWHGGAGCGTP